MTIDLNKKGDLQKAINSLIAYKESFNDKLQEFVDKLIDIGLNVAVFTLHSKGVGDSSREADFAVTIKDEGGAVVGTLSITSTPKEDEEGHLFYPHLAWEFGTGNIANGGMTSPNPYAGKFGMGPGTFPDQTHVPTPGFWVYQDNGGKHISYGTQATMPMYNASLEMVDKINDIAREVFGNGMV